ncbi:MAG: hypothetical protein QXZ43_03645 [Candidatus Aenigmatarchaeota archaeon]
MLKGLGDVIIFSNGDDEGYQQRKINACQLENIRYYIYSDKTRYIDQFGRDVIVIDDSEEVLRNLPDYVKKNKNR